MLWIIDWMTAAPDVTHKYPLFQFVATMEIGSYLMKIHRLKIWWDYSANIRRDGRLCVSSCSRVHTALVCCFAFIHDKCAIYLFTACRMLWYPLQLCHTHSMSSSQDVVSVNASHAAHAERTGHTRVPYDSCVDDMLLISKVLSLLSCWAAVGTRCGSSVLFPWMVGRTAPSREYRCTIRPSSTDVHWPNWQAQVLVVGEHASQHSLTFTAIYKRCLRHHTQAAYTAQQQQQQH